MGRKSEANSQLESSRSSSPLVPLIWSAATATSSLPPMASYAELVVLFMEIAKFTGSQAPLSTSSKVKVEKVGKERGEIGRGVRR